MPLYLSPYIGAGTRENPFRPDGFDLPGASAIDLRPDCTRADGNGIPYALLWLPDDVPVPKSATKLGECKGEQFSKVCAAKLWWKFDYRLQYFKDRTIDDAVATLLLRPSQGHWNPLRANRKGRVEAWLGGERWVDLIQPAGMTVRTDTFNRANESPIAGNWSPLPSSNLYDLVSNRLVSQDVSGGGPHDLVWNADLFTDDQFSQIQYISNVHGNDSPGVLVRASGASLDYYACQKFNGADLFKYVAGSYTTLQRQAYDWPVNDFIRLEATGGTLTFYADANNPPTTQIAQATDGTFTGGAVGVYSWNGSATLDNWSGGDLEEVPVGEATKHYSYQVCALVRSPSMRLPNPG